MNKSVSSSVNHAVDAQSQESAANITLSKAKQMEAERHEDPDWTARIIKIDNKTMALKWVRTDSINSGVF